jgi:hypothetical protein
LQSRWCGGSWIVPPGLLVDICSAINVFFEHIFIYVAQIIQHITSPSLSMNSTSDAPLPSSFAHFADGLAAPSALRAAITAACRRPEPQALAPLLAQARLPDGQAQEAHELAHRIAQQLRNRKNASGRAGLVQGLLQEYALSSQEGVALMCLAEALLRIPDADTRNALIRDKIAHGQWQQHAGRSPRCSSTPPPGACC